MTTIDMQSFILGMGLVLFIVCAIGGVVALVKVMRLEKNGNNIIIGFQQQIDETKTDVEHKIETVYRDMDSRLDKLYEKMMKNKSPKTEVFEMADKDGFKKNLLQVLNNEDEGNDLKSRILQLMNK